MKKLLIIIGLFMTVHALPVVAATFEDMAQADSYVQQHDYRKAKYIYFSAIDKGTYTQRAQMGLAKIAAHSGKSKEALNWLGKVLGREAHNTEALLLRAQVYSHSGQHDAALNDLATLAGVDDSNPELWRALDSVYSAMGDSEQAAQARAKYQTLTRATQ